jgi:hypothetical protein
MEDQPTYQVGDLVIWRNRCVAVVTSIDEPKGEGRLFIGHQRTVPLSDASRLATDKDLAELPTDTMRSDSAISLYELLELLSHLPWETEDGESRTRAGENGKRVWAFINARPDKVDRVMLARVRYANCAAGLVAILTNEETEADAHRKSLEIGEAEGVELSSEPIYGEDLLLRVVRG